MNKYIGYIVYNWYNSNVHHNITHNNLYLSFVRLNFYPIEYSIQHTIEYLKAIGATSQLIPEEDYVYV